MNDYDSWSHYMNDYDCHGATIMNDFDCHGATI